MSKRKLLLADDSITIQKVVNLTFADEGVEVISVSDGDAAMIKFNESMPDLVLADVNMPGLDGYRICEMIKQDDETKHIPVILLVGSFEPFDEQEAFRVGADDFLTKPFQSIRQLVTKVTDLLNPLSKSSVPAQETNAFNETEANNDWQFADTKELPVEELNVENLGDTGMDDEMIQTSQVSEPAAIDEVQQFISDSYSYKDDEANNISAQETLTEDSFQDESADDFAILEPTAETESERIADEDSQEIAETSDSKIYDFDEYEITDNDVVIVEESDVEDKNEVTEEITDSEEEVSTIETTEPEKISDWAVVAEETDEIEETKATEEITEEIEETDEPEISETQEIQISEETEAEETETFDENETVEDKIETEAEPEKLYIEPKSAVLFDDFNLLELPPLVEETGIRPQSEIKETKTVVEEIEPEIEQSDENIETVATFEIETATDETLAQTFPPELIEAVAQKVVEYLSDKVIREIAWEVVPQMSDLIVKKLADEQFNKKAKEMSE